MSQAETAQPKTNEKFLFWACFIALVSTSMGFIIRALIIDQLGTEFSLDETQKGEILGVGLWPFAVSIVLFSLIIDKVGYGRAMVFAFACHVLFAIITINATGYWSLYIGMLVLALGNGTVEAVINPAVATLFPQQKTKWLSILHAGWPGGLVIGGILAIAMEQQGVIGGMVGREIDWQWKVSLVLIPVIIYGAMMLFCRFPVHERVAAGISYREMLQEVGTLGCLLVLGLIVFEVTRVFEDMGILFQGWSENARFYTKLGITVVLSLPFALYVRTLGRPLFIVMLLIMIPLATTELGTDSWITDLMKTQMTELGLHAGWVLVYTSLIMMVLRFFSGPIVHRISPLGLLSISCIIAIIGLISLSKSAGLAILAAATIYGVGKSFFWPGSLGIVAEQFPKGGALSINAVAGVGMLGVGIIGNPLLGNIQDTEVDAQLAQKHPSLHEEVVAEPTISVFGKYQPLNQQKVENLPEDKQSVIADIKDQAKKNALMTVAIFPTIMLLCYIALILYFRTQGGYKPVSLVSESEEEDLMTGGAEGPVE